MQIQPAGVKTSLVFAVFCLYGSGIPVLSHSQTSLPVKESSSILSRPYKTPPFQDPSIGMHGEDRTALFRKAASSGTIPVQGTKEFQQFLERTGYQDPEMRSPVFSESLPLQEPPAGLSGQWSNRSGGSRVLSGDVVQEWVEHWGSGMATGEDIVQDMTIDQEGNIYVTGAASSTPFGYDCVTMKFDPEWNLEWSATYSGDLEGGDDIGNAICLDPEGNVIIAGASRSYTGLDILTVKYDQNGNEIWSASFNGSRNLDDFGLFVESDFAGRIAVAGSVRNTGTWEDFVVIQYGPDGNELWNRQYDGPGSRSQIDMIRALAVDRSGNVIVTGYSEGGTEIYDFDYATIRYDSEGDVCWVRRYDAPKNTYSRDYPGDLTVDSSGNSTVAGYITTETGTEWCTIQYSPDGDIRWQAFYRDPIAIHQHADLIVADPDGSVYVTGTVYRDCNIGSDPLEKDLISVKYDTLGNAVWTRIFQGRQAESNAVDDVCLDDQGNLYIVCTNTCWVSDSYVETTVSTFQYDPDGQENWMATYACDPGRRCESVRIHVDFGGNVNVLGRIYKESNSGLNRIRYIGIQYDPFGNPKNEIMEVSKMNSIEYPVGIAVDNRGNILAAGTSTTRDPDFNSHRDMASVKFDADGNFLWSTRYDNTPHLDDFSSSIHADRMGNTYIVGSGTNETGDLGFILVKYDVQGGLEWENHFSGGGFAELTVGESFVDLEGNLTVAGYTISQDFLDITTHYIVLQYGCNGILRWHHSFQVPYMYSYGVPSISICGDSQGNSIAVFKSKFESGTFIAKLNKDGREEWFVSEEQIYGPPYRVRTNAMNEIYVLCQQDYKHKIIKYDGQGNQIWNSFQTDTARAIDYPLDMILDTHGRILVAGDLWDESGTNWIGLIQYDEKGKRRWSVNTADDINGFFRNVILSSDGLNNIYLLSKTGEISFDLMLNKYDSDGNELVSVVYEYWKSIYPQGMAADSRGNVYVLGRDNQVFTLIKYHDPDAAEELVPSEPCLMQNYPNPFNSGTTIQYELAEQARVSLIVYDCLGRKVAVLEDGILHSEGRHQAVWNGSDSAGNPVASGVYVVRLSSGKTIGNKKIVLIR